MLPVHKILVTTDFSDADRAAFGIACALAREFGAELNVCHVAPLPVVASADGMVAVFPSGEDEEVGAKLFQTKPNDLRVHVTHTLLQGDPVTEIVRLAGDTKADLIVVGTHGRGGIGRFLLGSVAEGVLRQAPCPVLTVKAGNTVPNAQNCTDQRACCSSD